MHSVVLESPGQLTYRELPEPASPGPGEALVRVIHVGICGTDLHAFRGAQPFIRYPVVLGHELAVEVVELGPRTEQPKAAGLPADPIRVGDMCTVIPYLADGTCAACRNGRPNCCSALNVLGVHIDGGLRERFVLPTAQLVTASDIDPESLALVEMLAVGAHAIRRATIAPGESVLVVGAGPIGLSAMAFARYEAREVLALDIDRGRTAFAEATGLAHAIGLPSLAEPKPVGEGDAGEGRGRSAAGSIPQSAPLDSATLEASLRDALGGDLPDVVVDATGHRGSMERSVNLVEYGGRLVFVGHTRGELTFDNPTLHSRELTLSCSRNATRSDFDTVLTALRNEKLDVRPWITTRTPVSRIAEDFPSWIRPDSGVIKALASWS